MNTSEKSTSKNLDGFTYIVTSLRYFSRVTDTGNIICMHLCLCYLLY